MNGKTVNKSISFLFCDCFWLSSKQWIDFLNNSSAHISNLASVRYAVWISHLLLPFRSFHSFSSVSISRVWIFCRWKRICSSSPAEGCAVWWYSVWLTSSRHSFSCLKKKKSNTLNNQYRFVIISLLMSFSILSQIVILNQYRVWGNDQQMQRADLTIKTQCYKVTLDGLSYVVDTIVPFHYMLVQCRYLSFTKYLTPHFVTLVDCMNGQKVLIVGSINTQPESSRLQNSMNINTQGKNSSLLYLSL